MSQPAIHPRWRLSEEVFCVPLDQGEAALYVPRKGIVARVTDGAAGAVRDALLSGRCVSDEASPTLSALRDAGILDGEPGIDLGTRDGGSFGPTCVSLFLTTACNLRCVYCYANGGAGERRVIPRAAARAGIDLVAEHAVRRDERAFSVNFHGAGEPTQAWDLYRELVGYSREVSERRDLAACVNTCTNAAMPADRARWVARHTEYASVSLDGTAEIQDLLRPRASGRGSFEAVRRTLGIFDDERFSYMVRGTVCQSNVSALPEFVGWLCDHCDADTFQFEPMMRDGRSLASGCGGPDPATFVNAFSDAARVAYERGRIIGFSTLSLHNLRTYYCCAEADGFTVTHDGLLTACFGVCDATHAHADTFVYGRFAKESGTFEIDHGKIAVLARRNTGGQGSLRHCNACFCKYFCCGDCALNSLRGGLPLSAGSRCEVNRAVGANLLRDLLGLPPRRHNPGSLRDGPALTVDDRVTAFRPMHSGGAEAEVLDVRRYDVQESYYMRSPPPAEAARRLLQKGNVLHLLGRFDSALHAYESVLRQDGNCVAALANSAAILTRAGKIDDALARLRQAEGLAPGMPEVQGNLARALAASGKREEAIETLRRAVAATPAAAPLRLTLAWLLILEDRSDEASDLLEPVLVQESGHAAAARDLLGLCRQESPWEQGTGEGWGSEFARMLRSSLAAALDVEQARELAEDAGLVAAGRYQEVLRNLEAGSLAHACPLLHHWLAGLCLTRTGRTPEADAHLAEAVKLMPRVHLEPASVDWRLLVDGWSCTVDAGTAVAVAPGKHHLAVEFTLPEPEGTRRRLHAVDVADGREYAIGLHGLRVSTGTTDGRRGP